VWWNALPGVDVHAGGDDQADRVVAVACAARRQALLPHEGGIAFTEIGNEAEAFSDWIAEAGGREDRRACRLALCMACENPTGTRGDVLQAARAVHQHLTGT
jgi:hypothetical protein